MKRFHTIWRVLSSRSLAIAVATAIFALYVYRLASLTTGQLSAAETSTFHTSSSLGTLAREPLFLPLNVLRYLGYHLLPSHSTIALRLPSVALVLVTIGALLYITRRWYGQRIFLCSLLLLPASAWLLHVGRLATNDVAYLAVIPLLLAANLLLLDYADKKWTLLLWTTLMALLLYLPGGIWFVLATALWQGKTALNAFRNYSVLGRITPVVLSVVIVAPLLYGLFQQGSLTSVLAWVGLPGGSIPPLHLVLKNLVAALLFGFARSPYNPTLWLGKLPALDAFLTVGFLAGIIFYANHVQAERTRLLLMYGSIALVLCAVGGGIMRSLLVPLLYLVAFGGIAYILHQWLKMFPRNPLARRLGISLLSVAVVLSTLYGIRQYFIAWPHNADTRQAFQIEQ